MSAVIMAAGIALLAFTPVCAAEIPGADTPHKEDAVMEDAADEMFSIPDEEKKTAGDTEDENNDPDTHTQEPVAEEAEEPAAEQDEASGAAQQADAEAQENADEDTPGEDTNKVTADPADPAESDAGEHGSAHAEETAPEGEEDLPIIEVPSTIEEPAEIKEQEEIEEPEEIMEPAAVEKTALTKDAAVSAASAGAAFKETVQAAAEPAAGNGWKTENGGRCYYVNGIKATGIKTIGGKKYVFDEAGKLVRNGFATIGNKKVHAGKNGVLQTGWKTIDGKKYYFKKNGAAGKGIVRIRGKKYYFTWKGILRKSGKVQAGRNVYRIEKNGKLTKIGIRALKKGWKSEEGARFYYAKGKRVTGIRKIRGKKYLFDADGRLRKNAWVTIKGKTYRSDKKGIVRTGLVKIGNDHYFLARDGARQTGWITAGGRTYYFDENGVMQTGNENGEAAVHTHTWKKVTKTVHHRGDGYYDNVQAGTETGYYENDWDEPVYDTVYVCHACGYTSSDNAEMGDHMIFVHNGASEIDENGIEKYSYYNDYIQTGIIHHKKGEKYEYPVYESRWIELTPGWDETVTEFVCACGAARK